MEPATTTQPTDWTPNAKIVGAAIATLIVAGVQIAFPAVEIPPGVEGAIAVLAGYLIPTRS